MSDVHSTIADPPVQEPLGNSTEARTPEGTLKDNTEPLIPEGKKDDATTKTDDKKEEPKVGAPEKYEAFKVPEGKELSADLVTKASETFKGLNLTQEQAQSLVDLWNEQTSGLSDKLDQMVADQRADWRKTIATDKTLGNGTDNLSDASKKAISNAISHSGDAKVQAALKAALDLTGAGDHPDIVRAFVAFGKKMGEATLVKGGGPAKTGQTNTGSVKPTAAQALYPNLPSSAN